MKKTDAAYLAGLIDGEGSIALWAGFKKNHVTRSYRPIIEISNTHLGVLEWANQVVGNGWLKPTNKLNHRAKNHKLLYRVRFRTQDLRWLIPLIQPYLKIKGKQASLLLEYFALVTHTRPSTANKRKIDAIWRRFRLLNRRGL